MPFHMRFLVTPAAIVIVSALLAWLGWQLSSSAANSFTKIVLFVLFAIAALHATFFFCSWATDDASLKLVDYTYLIIALAAVAAVLDVQTAGMRYELNDSLPGRLSGIEEIYADCRAVKDCGEWEAEVMGYVRGNGYVHKVIKHKLDSFERIKEKAGPVQAAFFGQVKGLYDEMDDAYKRWGVPSDETEYLRLKLFFIYMFGIGAVIRLCKVTAELFNWRVAKETPVAEMS